MQTENQLKAVVAAILDLDVGDVGDDTSTDTVSHWDSVRHMNLVIALEEEFGVTIPDDEVATMTSYPLVRAIIDEQLKGR